MPRIRRKAKPRRGYTDKEIKMLLDGVITGIAFGGLLHKGTADLVAMRAAWDDLRAELLEQWIAEHPFTRPLAYWLFDAIEPRESVVGEHRMEAEQQAKEQRNFRLCYFESLNERLGCPDSDDEGDVYESEKQYLARLGLLTNEERALL